MPTTSEIKERYQLSGMKSRQVINFAIRRECPGGSLVLDAMTRLHEMQRGRPSPDSELQQLLDWLREASQEMVDWIKSDDEEGRPKTPGRSQVLRTMAQLKDMQRRRVRPDPVLADILDWLHEASDEMGVTDEPQQMTPDDLLDWRQQMAWTQRQAAEALGVALKSYQALERGKNWGTNTPVTIDRRTELACAALAAGITGYSSTH